jgi:hypothetical protein
MNTVMVDEETVTLFRGFVMVRIPVLPFESVIFAYQNPKASLTDEPSANCA